MTKKPRHTCYRCGQKLIEDKMSRVKDFRNFNTSHWKCIDTEFCHEVYELNRGVHSRS